MRTRQGGIEITPGGLVLASLPMLLLVPTGSCGPKAGTSSGTEPRPTPVTRTAPEPAARRAAARRPAKRVVKTTLAAVGLDRTAMDPSVKPCQDFYRFACGKWIERTEIPGDRPRWMRSFSEIHKRNEQVLKSILEKAAKIDGSKAGGAKAEGAKAEGAKAGGAKAGGAKAGDAKAGGAKAGGAKAGDAKAGGAKAGGAKAGGAKAGGAEAEGAEAGGAEAGGAKALEAKIGAYYRACMDEKKVNAVGLEPVRKLLRIARRVRDRRSLQRAITALHRHAIWALFELGSMQDFKDATQVIGVVDQAGLGLPDRDYYLKKDPRSKKIRAAYQKHVARMLRLAGFPKRRARWGAKVVLRIETALAKVSKTRVERRKPRKMYHRWDRSGLVMRVASFDWARYLSALGHPKLTALNVTAPKFFEGVNRLIKRTRARDWRPYLVWHVLHATAPELSKKLVDESFALTRLLTGQASQRARWKRCIASTDGALGELLAQPFVRQRFSPEAKRAVGQQVKAISRAFRELVEKLPWFDVPTRTQALDKLTRMAYLLGYPDQWKTYSWQVEPVHGANVLASRAHELQRELHRVGKPVDRGRWEMTPPTVNAYYHPLKNQMVFPAGILQPPFFSAKASIAVNLGGMGMVVAHELTHGFDDQGSQFDGKGNLRNWWTPRVSKRFEERTQCVVKQYASYEALPGVKLNGKLTAGENIADMGGIKLAFRAYRMLRAKAAQTKVAGGFTEDQQFFLSVAQIWCGKAKKQYQEMAAKVDPHSPPRWRVNGALANTPEFVRAFQCEKGTPMNPKRTCEVW